MRLPRFVSAPVVALLCLAVGVGTARAGDNIDVSTIPPREGVQLTIYNAEDITLVRETRTLTFAPGNNALQFSWHGTLIDPSSVELRFLTNAKDLDVIDTTYPHDRPQVLVWNVRAPREIPATVEITYFTSGITWAADYVITAAPDESTLGFDGFVRVTNNSGENYDNASIRLVVGEINLVEQIAELARRGLIDAPVDESRPRSDMELREVAGEIMRYAESRLGRRDQGIVKEGLSEYFIFTVPGRQDVPHQWSRRLALFEGTDVPNTVVYRFRPQEYGPQLVRLYTFRNDEASDLGESPLPNGIVRVFRRQGDDDGAGDGLAFLTAFTTKYIPIGQTVDINLGPDPEVIYEPRLERAWRDAFWFRANDGRTLVGPGEVQRVTDDATVVGWNRNERRVDAIRNGRTAPIRVEIRRRFDGDVAFDGPDLAPTRFDAFTAEFSATVPGATRTELPFTLTFREGTNAKQNRLEIR